MFRSAIAAMCLLLSAPALAASGTAPKNRYQIRTPTGTIGVRGTAFDFFVGSNATSVLLYHGAVQLCSTGGSCETLAKVCDLGQFDTRQAVLVGHADTVDDRDTLRSMFRYALSQRPLMSRFRIPNAERCLKRQTGGGGAKSLVDGPGGDVGPEPTEPPRQVCGQRIC